jgi:hypothetical protein
MIAARPDRATLGAATRGEVKARRYRERIPLLARRWDERRAKS